MTVAQVKESKSTNNISENFTQESSHYSTGNAQLKREQFVKGYSFGGKNINRGDNPPPNTPGPGAYKKTSQNSRLKNQPKFSFQQGTRYSSKKIYQGHGISSSVDFISMTPGPNAYSVPDMQKISVHKKTPAFSFGKPKNLDKNKKNKVSKFTPPKIKPAPGPGEYSVGSTLGGKSFGFGQSKRGQNTKQYFGPGVKVPYVDNKATYVGQRSSIGKQINRTSAPAFSFATGSLDKKDMEGKDRPWTSGNDNTKHSGKSKSINVHEILKRPYTSPSKKKEVDEYKFLRDAMAPPVKRALYEKCLDGADMLRSQEFHRPPSVSFGSGERFTTNLYLPHKPEINSSVASPGPTDYKVPEVLGLTQKFSFPKFADRSNPDLRRKTREAYPGPGAYNLTLQARVDAEYERLMKQESMDAEDWDFSLDGDFTEFDEDENGSLKSYNDKSTVQSLAAKSKASAKSNKSRTSMKSRASMRSLNSGVSTAYSAAKSLNLSCTFGDIPLSHIPAAPSCDFGASDRSQRSKVFISHAFDADSLGVHSPGPGTASLGVNTFQSNIKNQPRFIFAKANERAKGPVVSSNVGPAGLTIEKLDRGEKIIKKGYPSVKFPEAGREGASKLYQRKEIAKADRFAPPVHVRYRNFIRHVENARSLGDR